MTTYNNIFGNTPVSPASDSYSAYAISASIELSWAFNDVDTGYVVSDIMEIAPSTSGLTVTMPPADEVSVGMGCTIRNTGGNTLTVLDNEGGTIIAIGAGLIYAVYVKVNTDAAGTWGNFQLAVATSSADASTLAGSGLYASGLTLNTMITRTFDIGASTAISAGYRSQGVRWTGGAGTLTFSSTFFGSAGPYVYILNDGTGELTLSATSIDGGTSMSLDPSESVLLVGDLSGNLLPFGRYEIFNLITSANFVTATSASLTLTTATPGAQSYEITNAATSNIVAQLPTEASAYPIRYVPVSSGTPNYIITFTSSEGFPVQMVPGQSKLLTGGGTQPRDPADLTQREPSQNYAFFGDFSTNPWSLGTTFTSNSGSTVTTADRFVSAITTVTTSTSVSYTRATSTDTSFLYDMQIQRLNGDTGVSSIVLYGVLTSTESRALQNRTPMVVSRFKMGSSNFSLVQAFYLYRTGTGESNPITGTDWTTDTGGPYLTANFPTSLYSTYAYKGATAIPGSATQVAIGFALSPTGTAGSSETVNISHLGLYDADIFMDFYRMNPVLAQLAANSSLFLSTASAAATYAASSLTLTASGLISGGGNLSTSRTFTVTAASQSNMEAPTSTVVAVTPAVVQYHPGVAKAWVIFSGTSGTILTSHNVSTVTRTATGNYQIAFTTPFSTSNYVMNCMTNNDSGVPRFGCYDDDASNTTTNAFVEVFTYTGNASDSVTVALTFFGDQ